MKPNIKIINKKDFTQNIDQMVSIRSRIQKINSTALRFSQTIILSSGKLARLARNSARKSALRSLKAR